MVVIMMSSLEWLLNLSPRAKGVLHTGFQVIEGGIIVLYYPTNNSLTDLLAD